MHLYTAGYITSTTVSRGGCTISLHERHFASRTDVTGYIVPTRRVVTMSVSHVQVLTWLWNGKGLI